MLLLSRLLRDRKNVVTNMSRGEREDLRKNMENMDQTALTFNFGVAQIGT